MFRLALLLICLAVLSAPCRAENGATFSPSVLDFGRVPWGVTNTQLVTVTLTGEHLDDPTPPRLVFNGPPLLKANIQVSLFSQQREGDTLKLTYRITLPDIVGPVRGILWLETMSRDGQSGYPYSPAGITLAGEIVPCLVATTAAVNFGWVRTGQSKTEFVGLRAPNLMKLPLNPSLTKPLASSPPDTLDKTPHSSQSTYVSFTETGMGLSSGESSWQMWQLRLDPKTPPGFLQTTVTFTSLDGQIVVIPVTATVVQPGPVLGHKTNRVRASLSHSSSSNRASTSRAPCRTRSTSMPSPVGR